MSGSANIYTRPDEIENRSLEIIKSELKVRPDPELEPIILRVIHTTADFDYAKSLRFSPDVARLAAQALRRGVDICCDTGMVLAGVDKKRLSAFGGDIRCFTHDADVAEAAKKNGVTRSLLAIDKAAATGTPYIFAIGNAPTALLRICELYKAGVLSPALVVGVPVGFVNVVESKEALISSGIPYITAAGRKGGSNVAAAIVNALLRIASPY